jgi:tetratricopeptide (TPR) repeat protein
MKRPVVPAALVTLLVAFAPAAQAQGETADLLRQSRELYERLEIERALPILRRVVSPDWPFEVTDAQRVEAYKYLGASLSLVGRSDSAVLYFRAALERDPFTDLDPAQFTPAQVAAFAAARRRTFAVGVRAGGERRVDPRTQRVVFTAVTTHAAALRGSIRAVGGEEAESITLFDGTNEGARELAWDGLARDGRLAAPGRYEVLVIGRSQIVARTDTARTYVDLAHDVERLEDTLHTLAPGELLPERYRDGAAGLDLVKGLSVAAGALLISGILTNERLGAGQEARWVAGAAVGVGVTAFLYRRRHAAIPVNVAANETRRSARRAANDAIRQRNSERLGRTVLLIKPATASMSGP